VNLVRHRAIPSLVGTLSLVGCVYYNGLYNANRLADDAARAIREGRPAEARLLWERAAVKAESVAVRYPQSRYRDDALLLEGQSWRRAGQCHRAADPLTVVADSGGDPRGRLTAALGLAACQVELGDPQRAYDRVNPLVSHPDRSVAADARLWRARAALALGRADDALEDLGRLPEAGVVFDRAHALITLGRPGDAAAALHASLAAPYDERRWIAALDSLGRTDTGAATALVNLLVSRKDLTPGQRGRLLLSDGARLTVAGQPAAAARQLQVVVEVAPDSAEGRTARTRLLLRRIGELEVWEGMMGMTAALQRTAEEPGPSGIQAARALRVVGRVEAARESPHPDAALFVAAEHVRDSLGARRLAATLFRQIQTDHPASAIAPKALLAAAALDPVSAESLLALAEARYALSPYLAAARGDDPDAFAALEDSLAALVAASPAARARPSVPARPVGDEIRPPVPAPGRRVPEP